MPEPRGSSRQKAVDYPAACVKLNHLLSVRDRSVAEVRQRLAVDDFPQKVIDRVIEEARACQMLDDQRFLQAYIAGKSHLGWGRRKIEVGLSKHNIQIRSLPGYPEEFFDAGAELERAVACLSRFRSTAKNLRQAHYRRLLAKGFSADIAQKALLSVDAA